MRYLSEEWLSAFDAALQSDDRVRVLAADADLVVEQTVHAGPAGVITYQLVLRRDEVAVRMGADDTANVRLATDLRTATAIARGLMSAQEAFLQGHLRIGGDVTPLLAHRALLAAVDEAGRAIRDRTEW